MGCYCLLWFVSPTNLHCSQTNIRGTIQRRVFVSPTNLHYSQTATCTSTSESLFPLRIYTALKRPTAARSVLFVCFPYEFTLLSNPICADSRHGKFVSPTNLHCSQTGRKFLWMKTCLFPLQIYTALKRAGSFCEWRLVCFPYKFTLLSNLGVNITDLFEFVSPTNLHCSQTVSVCVCLGICLFPLRIYTALKHKSVDPGSDTCLFPLRIYTALKLMW